MRPHPRPFQDKRPYSQDLGAPQRRRRIKRGFGRLHRAQVAPHCSPAGTPPAETPNAKTLPRWPRVPCEITWQAWPAPSPAHYSAPSGVLHLSPSRLPLVRPCNSRRIGRASYTSSPATPCLGALGPQGHMGGNGMFDVRSMRQLLDPILQIFNSRVVGLGKCRMNQVSLQSGRMYKASRCPTPFWHEPFMDLIRIVGFIFTFGFINHHTPGAIYE